MSSSSIAEKFTKLSGQAAFNSVGGHNLEYPKELQERLPAAVWDTSCGGGNPFALGAPEVGMAVADLGCGAGVDICLAATYAGAEGRVLGIDTNAAMLDRARSNLELTVKAVGHEHCAKGYFLEASFDNPEDDALKPHFGQYDVVISNGALCLSFEKPNACRTAFSLLRPGGRFQLFDICLEDETASKVSDLGKRSQGS